MALRHEIPSGFELNVDRTVEPVRPMPVMRPPVRTGFRSGADLKDVFAAVAGSKVVEVEAAVGSGKSVRLPSELARHFRVPVLHVVPSELLAYDQSEYVRTVSPVDVEYVDMPAVPVGSSGVTYMSSATAVAKLLMLGRLSDVPVILFLDESHESDAYTFIMRSMGPRIDNVVHVIMASATFSMAGFRSRETSGEVEMLKYDPVPVKDWDPFDEGKPWSASNFRGNALIFVDAKGDAETLMGKLNDVGFYVHRLYAKMPREHFSSAMRDLRNKDGPIVVLIADYSFRSGFTFDVSLVIDSGMVAYMDVIGAAPRKCWRKVYELEAYQGAGRAGRLPGSLAQCYVPSGEVQRAICDLEGVELDAAAVLMRLLGYAVPRVMQHSVFASGCIPADIVHCLRDAQPFACLTDEHMESFAKPRSNRDSGISMTYASNVGSQERLNLPIQEELGVQTMSSDNRNSSAVECDEHRVDNPRVGGAYRIPQKGHGSSATSSFGAGLDSSGFWEDTFSKLSLLAEQESIKVVESGKFYYAEGISDQPRRSRGLPKGMESLQSMMAANNFTYRLRCMSADDRMTAIACALDRYNAVTAELTALSQILQEGPMSDLASGVRSDVKARWSRHAMELVSAHVSECMIIGSALPAMCEDVSALREMVGGLPETIDQFKMYHVEQVQLFGVGHAREVQVEYKQQLVAQDKPLIGDTPVRPNYAYQRGVHGRSSRSLEKTIVHRSTNVVKSNEMNVLAWFGGINPKYASRRLSSGNSRRFIDAG